MKVIKFIGCTLVFLSSQLVNSQQAQVFSIEDAKAYALENHLTVANASNDIDIARQQYVEVRGMGLPQVDLNGSFTNFINLPVQVMDATFLNPNAPAGETVSFRAGTDYAVDGTLQVRQLLFSGSYIIGLQAANFFAEFQKTVATASKEDVAFNVVQAYELATVAKSNKAFVDSLVITTQALIDKQQHYLELSLILQEDMDQLSYSLLSAQSTQTVAQINYENALYMLKLAMGYPINDPIDISNTPEQLMAKSTLSSGESIYSNINYMLLEQQVKLSEYNIKNNQFANLPSLNAFFQHTYNAYRNEFNFFADEKWFPQTLWGLKLNIPIFSGLTRHAKTNQARIKLMTDQNNLKLMEQNLQFQEVQYRNNLRGAENKLELQKRNVELATSIYNNEIIKEQIGKGNTIVVTQKHNQVMMAQSQYISSMIEYFQAKLALDKLYNKLLPNK